MQGTRQWRLSSAIFAALLFLAFGAGVGTVPAWALDDVDAQPQAADTQSQDDAAASADSTPAPTQQDLPLADTPAETLAVETVVVDSAPEAPAPSANPGDIASPDASVDTNDAIENGGEGDAAIAAGDGGEGADNGSADLDGEGSAESAAPDDGTEGESPLDGDDQADDQSANADAEDGQATDSAEETGEGTYVDDSSEDTSADEANASADDDNATADAAAPDDDAAAPDDDSATEDDPAADEAEATDTSAQSPDPTQKVGAESSKSADTSETATATKDAKRVLPSATNILKARNRIMWALMNGKTSINLEGFKLKFSREHDCDETAWYIIENALGYLGYTCSSSYSTPVKNGLYVLTKVTFKSVKKPSSAMQDAVEDMVSWAPESASTMNKVKAVHDWLVRHCSYNNTAVSLRKTAFVASYGYDPWSAESALVQGRPVCQGYSLAFMFGMARLGVPCEIVGSDDHAWNRVKIDGAWYNVDVTWDDSSSTTRWFMKSDGYFYDTMDHPNYNTRSIVKHQGIRATYNYTDWNTYRGSSYHGYVWDFKIARSASRMGTNSIKRLALQVTDGYGQIPYQTVRWSSTNKNIATVTQDGYVVSYTKHGKVKLVCNVNGVKHSCIVWVVGGNVKSSNMKRSLSATAFWYDGKKHVPTVTVRESTSNGKIKLRQGTDYTVTYLNAKGKKISSSQAKKRGTYYVLVKGKGLYSGSVKMKFQITKPTIAYKAHVQNIGWQKTKKNGQTAGTTGKSLRVEALKIQFAGKHSTKGSVQYRTHVQNRGWEKGWRSNGKGSGSTGQSLRLEAIQIRLTGDMAKKYDVYYRTHVQNKGWMGWAKNGQKAGSAGYAYRMEAIQVVLVKKGAKAPGTTRNHYAYRRR